MKKIKVFISQPMNNKSNIEIKKDRIKIIKELEKQGFEVLENILDLGEKATPLLYLSKSIEILDNADIVIFMPNWENSRGCVIEHEIALKYGKYVKEITKYEV